MRLSNNFVIKGAGYFSSKLLILSRRYIEPFNAQISSHYFLIFLSFTFVIFLNKSFFSAAWSIQGFDSFGTVLFYISLFPLLWLLTFFSLNFICIPGVIKPLSIFLLISGSLAAYFMDTYGVVIDKEMLRNTWETDADEVQGLFNLHLIGYFIVLGILPSLLILKTKIIWSSAGREFTIRIFSIAFSLGISFIVVLSQSSYYSSFFRNHKEVRFLTNPLGFVNAGISLLNESFQRPLVIDPISHGAQLGKGTIQQLKPVLMVFVVGETARAANFGLGGYSRNTTPFLEKQDIIYFNNFLSCGTSTAVSVPCMFSSLSRNNYNDNSAKSRHGLLDFIKTSGIDVLWRDNNSGCKGVCDRVNYESPETLVVEAQCENNNCYDDVLLNDITNKVGAGHHVIVLHQKGSHGPAYNLRYPVSMQFYTPVCDTSQLQQCSRIEVINAYDNTIRYTDYFLNRVIEWLKDQQNTHNTAMIYVSDHGESLGENNLYLHGMPYAIAPYLQKHVPFIFWASPDFYRDRGLNKECLNSLKNHEFSHDNIFHSVLGLLDINTAYYESHLDIFSSCL